MADRIDGEQCPMCNTNNLSLEEEQKKIKGAGDVFILRMSCSNCEFLQEDVEIDSNPGKAVKLSLEVSGEADLKKTIIKGAEATLKIPFVYTIKPGPGVNGFIKTVGETLAYVKEMLEKEEEAEEDSDSKKSIRKQIKKLNRVEWGSEKVKIIIEDPSGNSMII